MHTNFNKIWRTNKDVTYKYYAKIKKVIMSLLFDEEISKGGAFMEQQLAYSFHLGSDKNKSKLAKKVSKGNVSGTTSLSNNAIQNSNVLSKVNKHNLRDYDNEKDLIRVIRGTNDIVNDVKDLYLEEFEEARIEYNKKR